MFLLQSCNQFGEAPFYGCDLSAGTRACASVHAQLLSHVRLCDSTRLLCSWNFLGKNTGVGRPFPTLGDLPNPGIEHASLASPALASQFFFFLPLSHLGSPGLGWTVNESCVSYTSDPLSQHFVPTL